MESNNTSDLAKHQIELLKILGVFLVALISGNVSLVYRVMADMSNVLTWIFLACGLVMLVMIAYFTVKILLSIIDLLKKLKE